MLRGSNLSVVKRVYAIGDIHGRLDLFSDLIAIIARDRAERDPAASRIILLGDLVDRGPDSAGLVRGCMALARTTDRFVVLKGNHEAMMIAALDGNFVALEQWLEHGGRETLASFGVAQQLLDDGPGRPLLAAARAMVGGEVFAWLKSLPMTHRHGRHLFVHAGIRPGVRLSRQTEDDLLWITDEFLSSTVDHGMIVVHGHSITGTVPDIRPNRVGIDTGAYRSHILTCLAVEKAESWILQTDPRVPGSLFEPSASPAGLAEGRAAKSALCEVTSRP